MPSWSYLAAMADINTIDNPVWGLSTLGYGVLVEGLASIRQCLGIILTTSKGTDPLRPDFGCDIYEYIDIPEVTGVPNMKRAIVEAIGIWETRVKVKNVSHYMKSEYNPVFEITYSLVDEELIDRLILDLKVGVTSSTDDQEIILQAYYPPNPKGYPYQIAFIKSGAQVAPLPRPNGYASVQELFSWVQTNWGFYGRWNMLADRFVMYMKAAGVKPPTTLAISVLPITTFYAILPDLGPGEAYSVSFKVNGEDAAPVAPDDLVTPGALLAWVQDNWGAHASWGIEWNDGIGEPVFSDEFSEEFDTDATGVQYRLVGVSNVDGFEGELIIGKVIGPVFTDEMSGELTVKRQ